MIGGIQCNFLDVHCAERLDHRIACHVKLYAVLVRKGLAMVLDAVYAQAAGMDPVRPHLCGDVHAVPRHAMHEIFQHAEVLLSLVEAVRVIRHMQHPAVHPDCLRANAQEIRRRGIEIKRRTGEADLVGKELVLGLPFLRHQHWKLPVTSSLTIRRAGTAI